MMYELPESLIVCGTEYPIRWEYRDVLMILEVLNDAELSNQERGFLACVFFYPDFRDMPVDHYQEAVRQLMWFINGGKEEEDSKKNPPRLVDWENDFQYIVSPVNRVIGREIRTKEPTHWWTFLSAYMEIGDCTFAQIVRIRSMNAKGKRLDKADQEWYRQNRNLVDIKQVFTQEEKDVMQQWGVK